MSASNAVQAMTANRVRPVNDKNLSRFLQSRMVTRIFRFQPGWLNRLYLNFLGRIYFHYASGEREAIQTALKFSLGDRAGQNGPQNYWPQVRHGIMEHYYEKLYQAFTSYERLERSLPNRTDIIGRGELDQALDQGRGVILVTGHYGAVEFIPGILAVLGYPITAMVHCNTRDLRILLEEKTTRIGIRLLDPKEDSVFFTALKHLKEERILLTQCDEIDMWKPYKDREIDFLGFKVGLDRSLDLLARKSGSPVLFGLNHRAGRNRYQLHIEQLEQQEASIRLSLVSARCLSTLESYIYLHPEAWYEWKKFKPFLYQVISETQNENNQHLRITDQVAIHSPG